MKRKTQQEVEAFFLSKNCTLVDEYVRYHDYLEYICHCGDRDFVSYGTASRKGWSGGCSKHIKEKRKETNKAKTGYECNFQNPEWREKAKETYKAKTGYENSSQNPEVQKKKREEYKKKTGYDYQAKNPEVKEKTKKTNQERTGYDCIFQDPKEREKVLEEYKEKTGYAHPNQNPEVQEKARKRYKEKTGFEHPSQNPEVRRKQLQSMENMKIYTFPKSQRQIQCQGYEPLAVDILLSEGIKEKDILTWEEASEGPIKYRFNGSRGYYPDFYIKSKNLIVEVKSEYTLKSIRPGIHEKNKAKLLACRNQGYNTRLLVLDHKGKIIADEYEEASK